jgi:hypothetical protein
MWIVVWSHGHEKRREFPRHISSLRPSMQFTGKTESCNKFLFLDILVYKKGTALETKVCRKFTRAGRYLHFDYCILIMLREVFAA